MVVTFEAGRITRVEGDPENPATRGRVCLKGISYARRVSTAGRLLHPLRRRPDGTLARVTWDEALGTIAASLEGIRQRLGPQSVLYYEGSGSHGALGRLAMAFWRQFGGCTLTCGDLCWPAGLEATRLTYGANLHNHPRHTASSRFVLLWGHNPAETNIHQMRWIQDAQRGGAIVAVVDPRSTDTTDAADLHLQPRPGTDAALALGMARVMVEAGLHDEAFLSQHASGFDRYCERLREYPLGRVSAITGIPGAAIQQLALDYARRAPALLIAGFGLQRHHHAGQTMRAVSLLPALTGNIGVPGGGWQYANLNSHCLRDPPLPPEPPGVRRAIPVARLGPALGELDRPPVAAAWIEKGNPASQNPRSDLVRDALARLELVVVVDQFLTDTARLAHIVLPAKTMFEEEDLVTAYWHPYLQRRAKLWDAPGEARTETEIWRQLCERFGFDTSYFPADDEEVRRLLVEMLPAAPAPADAAPSTNDASARGMSPALRGQRLLDALAVRPVDPTGSGEIAFADFAFPTPSGRIEFASDEAARAWGLDPVPGYVPLDEGHESTQASRYPLQLLSCKTRDRIHSQFGNLDWVRDVERPHRLDMHPDDAAARGLREGDAARIWNDRGSLGLTVRIDAGLRPGVVHVLEGRCHEDDPDINQLTDAGVTDINHGATFYECLVEVGPAGALRRATRGGVPLATGADRPSTAASPPETAASRRSRAGSGPQAACRQPSAGPGRGFLLDLGRCVGCGACVLACRLENGWESGNPWRRVIPLNLARLPAGPTYFLSVACHHCEHPACVAACPSRAYEKRPDGVVVHHAQRCVGCRYCEMACPFGAPRFDAAAGIMTKCHLCHHRIDAGDAPACVAACPTEALRLRRGSEATDEGAARVPGFVDAAACGPNIRFVVPGGRRRERLYGLLVQTLERRP